MDTTTETTTIDVTEAGTQNTTTKERKKRGKKVNDESVAKRSKKMAANDQPLEGLTLVDISTQADDDKKNEEVTTQNKKKDGDDIEDEEQKTQVSLNEFFCFGKSRQKQLTKKIIYFLGIGSISTQRRDS